MPKPRVESVPEYIAAQPGEARALLKQVRSAIHKAVPGLEEGISYQIPVCKLNGAPLLFFAGWKKHFSLYPANDALVAQFKDEFAGLEISKGTIRFPLSEPVPVSLIERIAKFRAKQLAAREKAKPKGKKGSEAQLDRVRKMCASMPSVSEKLSHGAPTFFVQRDKGVFAMFVDNHHDDGHLAVWLPAPEGLQSEFISDAPQTYFKPPYVGSNGWIGIELNQITDEALEIHIREAWNLAARPKKKSQRMGTKN
jgi:uncharacterized protein YdhG (YjbR/CyaY superfamily)